MERSLSSNRWGGHRNPECCSPWGRKESDTTGQLNHHHHHLTEEIELSVNLTQSNTEERSNLTNYPKEFKFKGIAILDFPGGPVVKSLPPSTGATGPTPSLGDPTCRWQPSPRATGTTSALQNLCPSATEALLPASRESLHTAENRLTAKWKSKQNKTAIFSLSNWPLKKKILRFDEAEGRGPLTDTSFLRANENPENILCLNFSEFSLRKQVFMDWMTADIKVKDWEQG